MGSESRRAGSERSRFWPSRAWSHLRRLSGDSSSESCCCSLQQQWQHSAMAPMTGCNPSEARPQRLALLKGNSLLNAASTRLCGFDVTYGVPWGRPGNLSACAGPCGKRDKGHTGGSGHCPLRFSAHNRPYLMTMAAAASKQGIILGRLWKALLLSRSKRLKENKKLMKRPKRAKKTKKKKKKEEKKKRKSCPPIFSGKRPFIWVLHYFAGS